MRTPSTNTAAEYRKRAQDVRERAAWLSLSEARERLLELALQLDLLAEAEERGGGRHATWWSRKPLARVSQPAGAVISAARLRRTQLNKAAHMS